MITASPLGEEEPDPEGAREGDTCLSPGTMQGRGSGYPGDASAKPNPTFFRTQRQARCEALCKEREGAGDVK